MSLFSRRTFLKQSALAVTVIASGGLFGRILQNANAAPAKSAAKDIPLPAGATEVSKDDAVAKAIGYVSSTKDVDTKKYPQFKKGQDCSNCALYVKSNDGWGKCQMITNGLVRAGGWCGSYNKKA